jgi:hypothetical protein
MRSIIYGTCALNGQHTPGSKYAAECPVLRRCARSHQGGSESAGDTEVAGSPAEGSPNATRSGGRPKGSTTGGRFQKNGVESAVGRVAA